MPNRTRPQHPSLVPMHFRRNAAAVAVPLCLLAACGGPAPAPQVAGGDRERGREAIERYGCVACHTIPGIPAYGANVGPPLVGLARQAYVAGVLPNAPEHLVRWLRNPPAVDPLTAMPDLGVSREDAADIAAYLYAQ
jgi:cytochrome c2